MSGAVDNETRAFIEAVNLVEDAGYVVLHPSSARIAAREGGVKVKPLQWDDCDDLGLCADTVIGRYWMEPDDLASSSWQLRLVTILREEEHWLILLQGQISASAIQAAAQSHYEAAIRSAIVTGEGE